MLEELDHNDLDSDVIYSHSVLEFVTVANELCKLVEHVSSLTKRDFIDKSHKLLAFVYLKASMLPNFENVYEGSAEKFVAEHDWEWIRAAVENKLVTHNKFVDISDPIYPESDNVTSLSLAECFADIYQDLKDFTTAYNVGTLESMNDSLWECKESFQNYWGERLLAVSREFHLINYGVADLADEMPTNREVDSFQPDNWFTKEILSGDTDE